ncbi:hypothetical protein M405DRAFT_928758 [Rhizopogon salebrosus TDB-379]|nr:hypothetical protein M405DRAFT_928758 [Rhizopogon salebrosus TDB-379]
MTMSPTSRQPPSWPSHVQYINTPRYHTSVPGPMRTFLIDGTNSAPQKSSISFPSTRSPVRIRRISEPSHPARGQNGLFAVRKIPSRSHIIDYIGEVHCRSRADSDYDLSLFRSQNGDNVGVDASAMGNEARFINDYRGIRGKPNAVFVENRTPQGELRISIWSSASPIRKGDEILVSYGKSWWRSRTAQFTDAIPDSA